MFEAQEIINIKKEELLPKVSSFLKDGRRLVQICCTKGSMLVVDYSFDKNYKFTNLRLELELQGDTLPSITEVYFAAFTYENELHDLFGINVIGNKLDFGGKFYRTNETSPFNKTVCQEVKNA